MTEITYGTTVFTNAQKEIRSAFLGGFAGQLVSGLNWLASAAISLFSSSLHGVAFLFFGCMGIFPLTQLTLRIMGRSAKVSAENGLWVMGLALSGAPVFSLGGWFTGVVMIVFAFVSRHITLREEKAMAAFNL